MKLNICTVYFPQERERLNAFKYGLKSPRDGSLNDWVSILQIETDLITPCFSTNKNQRTNI